MPNPGSVQTFSPWQVLSNSIPRAPGAPLMFSRKLYPGSPALMRHRHSPELITPDPNTLKFARLQGSHLSIAYLVPGLVQWLLASRSQIPVNAPRSCTCCPAPDSRPELQWLQLNSLAPLPPQHRPSLPLLTLMPLPQHASLARCHPLDSPFPVHQCSLCQCLPQPRVDMSPEP